MKYVTTKAAQGLALAIWALSAYAADEGTGAAPVPLVRASATSSATADVKPAITAETIGTAGSAGKKSAASSARKAARQPEALVPPKPTPQADFAGEIEMFVGETRVLAEPNAGRLAVGNGKALSAAVMDDKEILLIANEVGVSSLHIWTRNGRNRRLKVTILPGETARVTREVAGFLATIPNTKASVVGDKVVVEGDGLTDSDLAKIDELAKRYPQIINFTNRIGWEKMIVMDVRVVEFPTTTLREIGLKWNTLGGAVVGGVWSPIGRGNTAPYQINLVTGQNNPAPISGNPNSGLQGVPLSAGLTALSMINLGLNAQLNLMEQNGTATILAQPTLSARSGAKASFLAGGEFPYPVSSINGTTILFKPYGIRLDIEPRVDRNGVIRAKIMSEVSDIDTSVTTTSGPALRTRKTETEFNVQEGGTIVLTGLLKRDVSTSLDKVPFLGDIPVLGTLFRSKRFQNNETELVVFVTPTAVDKHTLAQAGSMESAVTRLEKTPRVGSPDLSRAPSFGTPAAESGNPPIPSWVDPEN